MQYIKLGDSTLLEFNPDTNTTSVYNMANVHAEKEAAELRLAQNPEAPTDEQLLAWARQNYPIVNAMPEREALQDLIVAKEFLIEKFEELA